MSQHGSASSGGDESSDPDDNDHSAMDENMDDKKRGKKRLELCQEEMEKHFHMSQQEAARSLGVSVSTLKRRFYEVFNNMRWPYHHAVHGPNGRRGVLQLNQSSTEQQAESSSSSNNNNNNNNSNSSNADDASSSADESNASSSSEDHEDSAETMSKKPAVAKQQTKAPAKAIVSVKPSTIPAKPIAPRVATKPATGSATSAPKNFMPLHQLAAAARLYPHLASASSSLPSPAQPIPATSSISLGTNFAQQSSKPASNLPQPAISYAHSNYNAYYGSVPQQQRVPALQQNNAYAQYNNKYYENSKEAWSEEQQYKPNYPSMPAYMHDHQQQSFKNSYNNNQLPPMQNYQSEYSNSINANEKIVPLRPVVARYAPMSHRKHVSMSSLLNNDEMAEKQITKYDYDSLVSSMQHQQQMYSGQQPFESKDDAPAWPISQDISHHHIEGMRSHNNYAPQASNAALARRYQPYQLNNERPGPSSPSAFK